MRQVTKGEISRLLADHDPPCVSLYQPTHLQHPENQQDPIRYKNLLGEMENALRDKYPSRDSDRIIEKFHTLANDKEFWDHRTHGLAILSSREKFRLFELQRPVDELVVVADSFHIKPLLRMAQSADTFQVLCLSRHQATLYEGNRDAMQSVDLSEIPSTIEEALGSEKTETYQSIEGYGTGDRADGQAMHHGQGSKKDEVEIDTDRFFRVIDREIWENYSRPSGLPLMLAALPEHHAHFHAVSHNPNLMAEGIMMNPDALSAQQLCEEAWRILEPHYRERLTNLIDDYQLGKSRDLASDDLSQIALAAIAGRIGTLLVESERKVPGSFDYDTGEIRLDPSDDPTSEDILDDLAELVLRLKGDVVVIPAVQMPSETGAAAIYRY